MFKFKKLMLSGMFFIFSVFLLSSTTYAGKVPVYKVGIDAAFPPWAWVEKGKVKGFDWELLQYIGKAEGFKIKHFDIPWSAAVSALSRGKIDILASGLSFTCKRAKIIDYTLPYWKIGYWTLVKGNSKLNCVTAMSHGAKVGVQIGSPGYRWVKEELKDNGVDVNIKGYESVELGIKDLEDGRIDSFHLDSPPARGFVNAKRDVKPVCKGLHYDYIAFGVTPGDPHKLLNKLNDGLKKAYKSGEFGKLVRKYLPWGSATEKVPYNIDYKKLCSKSK